MGFAGSVSLILTVLFVRSPGFNVPICGSDDLPKVRLPIYWKLHRIGEYQKGRPSRTLYSGWIRVPATFRNRLPSDAVLVIPNHKPDPDYLIFDVINPASPPLEAGRPIQTRTRTLHDQIASVQTRIQKWRNALGELNPTGSLYEFNTRFRHILQIIHNHTPPEMAPLADSARLWTMTEKRRLYDLCTTLQNNIAPLSKAEQIRFEDLLTAAFQRLGCPAVFNDFFTRTCLPRNTLKQVDKTLAFLSSLD